MTPSLHIVRVTRRLPLHGLYDGRHCPVLFPPSGIASTEATEGSRIKVLNTSDGLLHRGKPYVASPLGFTPEGLPVFCV